MTKEDRYMAYKESIKDTWSVGCVSCHQPQNSGTWYKGGLKELKTTLDRKAPMKHLYEKSIAEPHTLEFKYQFETERGVFVCSTCNRWLIQKKERPPLSPFNGLWITETPKEVKELNHLERTLISKRILFIKIFKMPTSRWHKVKDKTVNVPICDDTLLKTLNKLNVSLPRKPEEAGLIPVQLKRKLEFNNVHYEAYVRKDKMEAALMKLKEMRHSGYTNLPNIPVSNRFSVLEDEEVREESEDEQEVDQPECIRQNQWDMGGSTTMTNMYPETTVVQERPNARKQNRASVKLAPGEGKVPTDLMRDDDWDINSHPHLFPDG